MKKMYLVVFHPSLFCPSDHGCRVYHEDDPYLQQHPSMYQELDRFNSDSEAQAFCDSQPTGADIEMERAESFISSVNFLADEEC